MTKHIIWSSEIELDNWKDFLEEEYPDVTDESEQYDIVYRLNNEYLYDERANLHTNASGRIILIADIGRWNGRVPGYLLLSSNIADILYTNDEDIEWYSDGKDIRAIGQHHDGTNYYQYRVIRENRDISKLCRAIYNGETISRQKLNYYTKSLHPDVAKVYGW